MNGVINIYKEKGCTSFHVVYELRKLTGEQKVGHTGTLDPDVTGVLPVCIGKATKLVGQLTDTDKIYKCRMLLGRSTDTQDYSGQTVSEMPLEQVQARLVMLAGTVDHKEIPSDGQTLCSECQIDDKVLVNDQTRADALAISARTLQSDALAISARTLQSDALAISARTLQSDAPAISAGTLQSDAPAISAGTLQSDAPAISTGTHYSDVLAMITGTLHSFEGETQQLPPMYSALKVDGMKLVNAARKGVEVERKTRPITIYSIYDIGVSEDLQYVDYTVHCSKGTYVRTLCEDIGKKLGIPACMYQLERTCASGLDLSTAITLDQAKAFAAEGRLQEHMIPPDTFLTVYDSITVNDEAVRKLIYGNYMYKEDLDRDEQFEAAVDGRTYRVYDRTGEFYALYGFSQKGRCFKCLKMFRDL